MPNKRSRLLLTVLGGSSDPSAFFTVTTSGAQTLTINALTVSADTTVSWGDGSSDVYTAGAGARTHNYAGAGTWRVRILQPLNVTVFALNAPVPIVRLNSANIKGMVNCTNFTAINFGAGNSGAFNSADLTTWRPTSFSVVSNDNAFSGVWNFADLAGWNPTKFHMYFSPAFTYIMAAANFSGWIAANDINIPWNTWSQAQVDAVLLGMYIAAQSRTITGGTLAIDGDNAAPSGTLAAMCPPTTGKAAAYELVNDSCGVIAAGETWATVTTN
jgi:hypothetical protein